MRIAVPLILVLGLIAACMPQGTPPPVTPTSIQAELAGDNEVPAVATTANGMVEATLDGDTLTLSGTFSGLESDLLPIAGCPAHVHVCAAGENGPVAFVIDVASSDGQSCTLSLEVELDAEEREQFSNGLFYVNIHTEANQPGELRAQLFPYMEAVTVSATFTGDAEVPPVMTSATGMVEATLDGFAFSLSGSFEGLESDLEPIAGTPAHVQEAAIGENGPVVFLIDVASADERSGTLSLEATLNDVELAAFLMGSFYVNIHAEGNPGGELRAQLEPGVTVTVVRVAPESVFGVTVEPPGGSEGPTTTPFVVLPVTD